MKWLPIKTAPQDGSSVLLTGGEVMVVAWWDYDWKTFENDGARILFDGATHWQPLPDLPK
jgi:hypothetical protein